MKMHDDRANEFLARLSHDLRTPVVAILGYIDNLDAGIRGEIPPQQRSDLGRIRRAGHHLLALIEDIQEYATLDRGRLRLTLTEVSLALTVSELESLTRPQMSAKRITFNCGTCSTDLCQVLVRADRKRLMQVLTNLLTNAIKFTPPDGRITITCVADSGEHMAEVRVRDTGPGIPADQIESVFEPYVRLDNEPAGAQPGIGLGLAISRDWARAMGGELKAESRLGSGSTFTLTLPRV